MYDQTIALCESLPHFAQVLKAADRKGSSEWEIVRWVGISPKDVQPEQVQPIPTLEFEGQDVTTRFDSRTQALRFSAQWVRTHTREHTEKNHWGVWRWIENGQTMYQTALPVNRTDNRSAVSEKPPKVSSPSTGTSSVQIRLNERTYNLVCAIADEDGITVSSVLEEAVKEYRRQRFFARADAAYKALRSNPTAWDEEQQERQEWDGVLLDNQEPEETLPSLRKSSSSGKERKSA